MLTAFIFQYPLDSRQPRARHRWRIAPASAPDLREGHHRRGPLRSRRTSDVPDPPDEAARNILGITLAELGRAIGQRWSLPSMVLDCMDDGGAGSLNALLDAGMQNFKAFTPMLEIDPDKKQGSFPESCC